MTNPSKECANGGDCVKIKVPSLKDPVFGTYMPAYTCCKNCGKRFNKE